MLSIAAQCCQIAAKPDAKWPQKVPPQVVVTLLMAALVVSSESGQRCPQVSSVVFAEACCTGLHHLDVESGADRQRRVVVPQIMELKPSGRPGTALLAALNALCGAMDPSAVPPRHT
jgi:hypothetical protein